MNAADFLSGISMATFAASAIFFLKFWIASKDRFFLMFSAALACLSIERVVLFVVHDSATRSRSDLTEANSWVYLIRLLAFSLILAAIIIRNRNSRLP